MSDLERIDGFFVGQLDANELRTFTRAVQDGEAVRSYEGGAGFMGLAKVRVVKRVSP
jgi:hypothetical protein